MSNPYIHQFYNGTYVTDEYTAAFVRTLGSFEDDLGLWIHSRNEVVVKSMIEMLYNMYLKSEDDTYIRDFKPKDLGYVFSPDDC